MNLGERFQTTIFQKVATTVHPDSKAILNFSLLKAFKAQKGLFSTKDLIITINNNNDDEKWEEQKKVGEKEQLRSGGCFLVEEEKRLLLGLVVVISLRLKIAKQPTTVQVAGLKGSSSSSQSSKTIG